MSAESPRRSWPQGIASRNTLQHAASRRGHLDLVAEITRMAIVNGILKSFLRSRIAGICIAGKSLIASSLRSAEWHAWLGYSSPTRPPDVVAHGQRVTRGAAQPLLKHRVSVRVVLIGSMQPLRSQKEDRHEAHKYIARGDAVRRFIPRHRAGRWRSGRRWRPRRERPEQRY